jgi:serine protease inhibitor
MRSTARITWLGVAALAAALAVAGCGAAQITGPQPPGVAHGVIRGVAVREPAADPRPYGTADTAFGLDVLGAWCRADPQANLVLSPTSLASGLGMAYLAARGATARAMAGVLHLPAAGGALAAGLQARSAALRALSGPGVTVAASDQVWADPGLPLRAAYLNSVATGYDAGVAQVPLVNSPDQAAQEIDQAIAAATRGHIPQLLGPGSLRGIGWVLTDALYLNAAWATPFQASETSTGPFTTAGGHRVSVSFMNGGGFRTATAAGWTAVSLPYQGGKLSMVALLPAPGSGNCVLPPATALGALTTRLGTTRATAPGASTPPGTGGAAGTGGTAVPAQTSIALPRVNLSTRASLKGLLGTLGLGAAFGPAADFTGMSPAACCIGLVEHAATLQVGEKGTVASAATAVGISPTAARAGPTLVFDRPYLLLVTATATGEPLFAARVGSPIPPRNDRGLSAPADGARRRRPGAGIRWHCRHPVALSASGGTVGIRWHCRHPVAHWRT